MMSFGHHHTHHIQRHRKGLETCLEPLLLVRFRFFFPTILIYFRDTTYTFTYLRTETAVQVRERERVLRKQRLLPMNRDGRSAEREKRGPKDVVDNVFLSPPPPPYPMMSNAARDALLLVHFVLFFFHSSFLLY